MTSNNIANFLRKNKLKFKDVNLIKQVFVHRSYLNENPSFRLNHNERLEFLGDAVLELTVTEFLYNNFDNPEGDLTNWRSALVRGKMLADIAKKTSINDYLFLSRGESQSTGKAREIILANAFEALIGAIYLDQGYKAAKKFVENNLIINLNDILDNKLYVDAKSHLQEIAQEEQKITPRYNVISETGPDHNKHFEIGVYLKDKLAGIGVGTSKQEGEQNAASKALEKLGNR